MSIYPRMTTPIPVYDRVKETTISGGTGSVTLNGAVFGFRSFADTVGIGNKTYYGIIDNVSGQWEIGIGTIVDASTLSRDYVFQSTDGVTHVSFAEKKKVVIIDVPAVLRVTASMLSFTYNQTSPSSSWTIHHNLNRFVSVTVIDSANTEIEGEVVYIDENTVQANFSVPFSGTAYCN